MCLSTTGAHSIIFPPDQYAWCFRPNHIRKMTISATMTNISNTCAPSTVRSTDSGEQMPQRYGGARRRHIQTVFGATLRNLYHIVAHIHYLLVHTVDLIPHNKQIFLPFCRTEFRQGHTSVCLFRYQEPSIPPAASARPRPLRHLV